MTECRRWWQFGVSTYIFHFISVDEFVRLPLALCRLCLLAFQLVVLSLRRQSRSLLRLLLLYFIILSTQFEVQTSVGDKAEKDIRQATTIRAMKCCSKCKLFAFPFKDPELFFHLDSTETQAAKCCAFSTRNPERSKTNSCQHWIRHTAGMESKLGFPVFVRYFLCTCTFYVTGVLHARFLYFLHMVNNIIKSYYLIYKHYRCRADTDCLSMAMGM